MTVSMPSVGVRTPRMSSDREIESLSRERLDNRNCARTGFTLSNCLGYVRTPTDTLLPGIDSSIDPRPGGGTGTFYTTLLWNVSGQDNSPAEFEKIA